MIVICPKCGNKLNFADADPGAVVACSGCGKRLRLPAAAADPLPEPRRAGPPPLDRVDEPPDDSPAEDRPEDDDADDKPRKKRKGRKLGPVEAVYRGSSSHLWAQFLGIGLLALFGLFLLLMALMSLAPAPNVGIGQRLFALLGLGSLGLGATGLSVWLSVRQVREYKKRVLLARDGFAIVRGGRRTVYYWDDIVCQYQKIIDHYVNGVYAHTTHVYTMECVDGTRVVLNDSLKKVKELGEVIAEQITRRELPLARADYDAGRLVSFGKLGVKKKGLIFGESFLTWKEVKGVRITDGYISVSKKGKWLNWCSIGAASVPNLAVFLTLVDEIIGVEDK